MRDSTGVSAIALLIARSGAPAPASLARAVARRRGDFTAAADEPRQSKPTDLSRDPTSALPGREAAAVARGSYPTQPMEAAMSTTEAPSNDADGIASVKNADKMLEAGREEGAFGAELRSRDQTRAVFGQAMALVATTPAALHWRLPRSQPERWCRNRCIQNCLRPHLSPQRRSVTRTGPACDGLPVGARSTARGRGGPGPGRIRAHRSPRFSGRQRAEPRRSSGFWVPTATRRDAI